MKHRSPHSEHLLQPTVSDLVPASPVVPGEDPFARAATVPAVNGSSAEAPAPTSADRSPSPLLHSDARPTARGAALSGAVRAAITSWRPNAQLPAIERYGRFEILGRIGRGGMAEILLARERSFAGTLRHLVVKRMLPENAGSDEMLRMFLAEARVVMGLSHPNLCQIYEVGEQDGAWFIAMEWVNGVTLHQLIRRACDRRDQDYAVVAKVLAQCSEALHHAHTARDADGRPLCLVHRDVSPHNLMVAYDGRVKLLDFGIAKSTASTHHTEAGIVKGKVCYMAPEQWRNETLDARTDVFALGACLFEVLTGQMAFRRETQGDVMRAIVEEPVPRITDMVEGIPEALSDIVERALAKDPAERFQSALEMSDALERFVTQQAEPVSSARIADYARRLFPSEVSLGPMLERAVRGAQLGHGPMLPPVPRVLSEQETEFERSPAFDRPLLPRLLGASPLPAPPAMPAQAMPAPTEPVATPSRPPSRGPTPRGIDLDNSYASQHGAEFCSRAEPPASTIDAMLGFGSSAIDLDSFQSFETVDDVEQSSVRPAAEGARAAQRGSDPAPSARPRGPSAFSDAPTRPLPGISGEIEVPQGEPRHVARTESMHVPTGGRRRAAIALLATAVGAALGLLSYDSLRTRAPRAWQPSQASAPIRTASELPAKAAPAVAAATAAETAPAVKEAASPVGGVEGIELTSPLAPAPEVPVAASPDSQEGVLEPSQAAVREERARGNALLSINTRPWSTVYLGQRVLGTTPLANVPVPNKALKLKLIDRDGRQHIRRVPRAMRHKRSVFYDFEKQRD